jgi:hypothetical protein
MIEDAEILDASIRISTDDYSEGQQLLTLLQHLGYARAVCTATLDDLDALKRDVSSALVLIKFKYLNQKTAWAGLATSGASRAGQGPVVAFILSPGEVPPVASIARDFVLRPFEASEVRVRVRNMLEIRILQRRIECGAAMLQEAVQERTAELRESEARY